MLMERAAITVREARSQPLPHARRLRAGIGALALSILAITGCNDGPPMPPPGYCLSIRDGNWVSYPARPDGSADPECIRTAPTIQAIRDQKKK